MCFVKQKLRVGLYETNTSYFLSQQLGYLLPNIYLLSYLGYLLMYQKRPRSESRSDITTFI